MIRLMSINEWHRKEFFLYLSWYLWVTCSFTFFCTCVHTILYLCSCEVLFLYLYLCSHDPASITYLRGETSKAVTLHSPSSGLCKWYDMLNLSIVPQKYFSSRWETMGSSDFVDYPTLGSSDFLPGLESKRLLMNDRRGWSRILEYQIWLNGQDWIGLDWIGLEGESETNSLPPAPPGMLITVAVAMLSSIYRSKNLSSFENTLPYVSSFKDVKSPPARVSLPLTNGCNCTYNWQLHLIQPRTTHLICLQK